MAELLFVLLKALKFSAGGANFIRISKCRSEDLHEILEGGEIQPICSQGGGWRGWWCIEYHKGFRVGGLRARQWLADAVLSSSRNRSETRRYLERWERGWARQMWGNVTWWIRTRESMTVEKCKIPNTLAQPRLPSMSVHENQHDSFPRSSV